MKFGKFLENEMLPSWQSYYVDYKGLKKILKSMKIGSFDPKPPDPLVVKSPHIEITHTVDEMDFASKIDIEIEKINTFVRAMSSKIRTRTERLLVMAKSQALTRTQAEEMSREVEACESDMINLERFININVTGFVKILKKHDKHSSVQYGQAYMVRLWRQPFLNEKLEDVVTCLGMLHGRLRMEDEDQQSVPHTASENVIRRTTKYWVRMEHVTQMKFMILKKLPILPTKDTRADSRLITSVYLDNQAMDMYTARLTKLEGASVLRIRWHGVEEPTKVSFEKKTLQTHWTGDAHLKEKLTVDEYKVAALFYSLLDMDQEKEDMRRRGVNEDQIDKDIRLTKDIQSTIEKKELVSTIRTAFTRTTFQYANNKSLRITLDTNVNMMIEKCRMGEWKRDTRKSRIPESHIARFPFAVLKIKIMHDVGEEIPQWIQDLLQTGMLIEVPKFSKYIHGCAVLLPTIVPTIPHWLRTIGDPKLIAQSALPLGKDTDHVETPVKATTTKGQTNKTKPSTESATIQPQHSHTLTEAHGQSGGHQHDAIDSHKQAPSDSASSISSDRHSRHSNPSDADEHGLIDPLAGKKVVLPMKTDPRAFFSNERTFIAWIKLSLTICIFSLGLYGARASEGMVVGSLILLGVGCLFTFYAFYIYAQRVKMMRTKHEGPLDDLVGTGLMVLVLNLGVVMSAASMLFFTSSSLSV
eukprot:TRINITY_DN10814_c0_g1_i1.p1 TRINITY_DN10814_c0_g1~~TRINITY_DN10814_c0_g1_i1.p1  ORF type:complete len:697 (+),score=129.19 TRINITY_DN10814_c0_g1_i1:45-2135(+)